MHLHCSVPRPTIADPPPCPPSPLAAGVAPPPTRTTTYLRPHIGELHIMVDVMVVGTRFWTREVLSAARRNHNADRLAKPDFKPLGMYHTSPGTTHLQSLLSDSSRLTEPPLLPKTARFQWPLSGRYRLAACPAPPSTIPSTIPIELRLLVFGTLERFSMNPNNPYAIQNINHTYPIILA
ncbi:hypothetical protein DEO72_LG3g749 [Vigna unguiculata]|uniref:Uncharacterized protein n=1 Tax=Vigna unguiculata TaxID=3917 RepID=A0A4D6LCE7_VIGUN|nr:hypothetical protein DEO72_LG3g749 [Vigna unguiculata]